MIQMFIDGLDRELCFKVPKKHFIKNVEICLQERKKCRWIDEGKVGVHWWDINISTIFSA